MTGIELEHFSDIEMHFFVKKGIRPRISYIAKRYSKEDNRYMKEYDCGEESKFLIYLDANNLYGWEISQYLPYGGFKWLNQKEI